MSSSFYFVFQSVLQFVDAMKLSPLQREYEFVLEIYKGNHGPGTSIWATAGMVVTTSWAFAVQNKIKSETKVQ